ncbi:hypothetical protein WJX82_009693 [Trebouxia sp. C0006]
MLSRHDRCNLSAPQGVIDPCEDLSSKVLWLNMTKAGHYQLVVPRDAMRLMKPKLVDAGFDYWLMPHDRQKTVLTEERQERQRQSLDRTNKGTLQHKAHRGNSAHNDGLGGSMSRDNKNSGKGQSSIQVCSEASDSSEASDTDGSETSDILGKLLKRPAGVAADDEARVRPVGGVGSHTSVTGQVLRPAIALERRKHTSRLMNAA